MYKYFGNNVVLGTATNFGDATRDGRVSPAWTIRFDEKVVVYEKGRRKAYYEDLDIIEMEDALELTCIRSGGQAVGEKE